MSVAVGVLGWNHAAIAADSHYVDLSNGATSSITKTVNANGRIGALTGLSSYRRRPFTDFLLDAMAEALALKDVDRYFLRIGGDHLVAAYELYYQNFGVGPNEFPIQLLVAGRIGGRLAMVEAQTYQDTDGLRIDSQIKIATSSMKMCRERSTAPARARPLHFCTCLVVRQVQKSAISMTKVRSDRNEN